MLMLFPYYQNKLCFTIRYDIIILYIDNTPFPVITFHHHTIFLLNKYLFTMGVSGGESKI